MKGGRRVVGKVAPSSNGVMVLVWARARERKKGRVWVFVLRGILGTAVATPAGRQNIAGWVVEAGRTAHMCLSTFHEVRDVRRSATTTTATTASTSIGGPFSARFVTGDDLWCVFYVCDWALNWLAFRRTNNSTDWLTLSTQEKKKRQRKGERKVVVVVVVKAGRKSPPAAGGPRQSVCGWKRWPWRQ